MASPRNGSAQLDLLDFFPELGQPAREPSDRSIQNEILKQCLSQQRQIRGLYARKQEMEGEIESLRQWVYGLAAKIKELEGKGRK